MANLAPLALAAFSRRYPDIDVDLHEGTTPSQLKALEDASTDLAIVAVTGESPGDRFTLEALLDDPLLLAVERGHALALERAVDPDDLAAEAWSHSPRAPSSPRSRSWRPFRQVMIWPKTGSTMALRRR
ncbi:LysR substrate-binding domain-containing protein [Streptomyces sp. H10-C2]|uniref:LysR substrate-binding domain-containing protein n=1 Tax=unclassified Streptomyces TaxID=2593676 RepID=UPI0024B91206|nr:MULTISPECIES: LysR substrate-binding domain-containing protein [unclassified Streptomyces]MDJ0344452.1 LysR substrate-binding domain-containing protein [Streptomyces sp. PH10-H1]MDJ0372072.1 LysR substrate-binding domain-containing protein [Streptomyces sp. H10-C2]